MPKVFVTGVTGLLGGAVVKAFVRHRYEVVGLARPGSPLHHLTGVPMRVVQGDLYNEEHLREAMRGCDALIHVAGAAGRFYLGEGEYEKTNVLGSEVIYRAARAIGIRRSVLCGTTGIGMRLDSDYGYSKLRGAYVARREAGTKMEVIAVHPSGMTGPGDVRPTPLGKMILYFARKEIPIGMAGGCGFIHVDDAAEGHVAALERGDPTRDYILSAEYRTLDEVFTYLSDLLGIKKPFLLPEAVTWTLIRLLEPIYARMNREAPFTRWSASFITLPPQRHPDGEADRRALGLTYRSVKDAFIEAVDWFREQGYLGAPVASASFHQSVSAVTAPRS